MATTDPPNVGGTTSPQPLLSFTLVHDLVERQLSEVTESSWSRPLIFRGCLVRPDEIPHSVDFKQENLVEYTNNLIYKNCKVYFDREQYAPLQGSQKIGAKDPAWKRLCTDLLRAGHDTGLSLIANGQASNGSRKLICSHGIFYDKRWAEKKHEVKKDDYRTATLNADYKNNRDDGRKHRRRTSTGKPQQEKEQSTCKWRLSISCDEHGFYMHCGIGCGEHSGHPPPLDASLQTTRMRLLQQHDKDTLTHLGNAHANAGVGRNYMFSKTGLYMSRSQVRYLYTEPWQLPKPTDGARPLDDIALDISTPPCQLLENFRSRDDISYSCLFNDAPIESPQLANQQGEQLIFAVSRRSLLFTQL